MRFSAIILMAILMTSGAVYGQVRQPQRIFVSNEDDGTVFMLDAASLQVVARLKVGPQPHNMALVRPGLILIATQASTDLAILDVASRRVRKIPLGARPHDVETSADGRRAIVVTREGVFVVVDVRAGQVLRNVQLEGNPHDLAVIGDEVWVTDISSAALPVVSALDGAVRAKINLRFAGHDLAVRPGGAEVWVTPWSGDAVSILDARTGSLRGSVKIGQRPQHLAFAPDGREVWITDTGISKAYVVSAADRRRIATVDLGGPPHHVAVDGRRAYVATGHASLDVVDVRTQKIVARIPVGKDPHDVVVE